LVGEAGGYPCSKTFISKLSIGQELGMQMLMLGVAIQLVHMMRMRILGWRYKMIRKMLMWHMFGNPPP